MLFNFIIIFYNFEVYSILVNAISSLTDEQEQKLLEKENGNVDGVEPEGATSSTEMAEGV